MTSSAESGPFADAVAEDTVLESSVVFRGAVWDIVRERFRFGGEVLTREFMSHTGAVAVLVLDDADRILFIRQYRHPVGRRDWELPAGLLDAPGEDPLDAAKRELGEEVDLLADRWDVLLDQYTSPGGSSENVRVYLARGLSATPEAFDRTGEEAELEQRWVALPDALEAVLDGSVQNPFVVSGVMALHLAKERSFSTLRPADAAWPTRSPGRPE
ncbi:ADP-ribose pyrophosphatase [Pseudoclavibacter sp. RFBJ3]|uniref:NUDIX domain-containing protein n=1 Tax=unclassified Pseudoclavibacter TaxID=2615177 RepID=UPI000CE773D7|nr:MULTISPECIES: NUDIX hydrolase [unclassified Pseudoclavibacter]MBF4458947.1 NUDIX hydrolase [Pseudoclavibacter sp. VKM Ac-2867]MBF4548624.1 NUDIX hydrolase [Pseudoclavibacter sp. VKM Ac-2888]PPF75197.1 ADP-ribose pyrophosphatase [Pseudoclavibacter sp. Z016]PPF86130.1 ADP-ribose pyrophosphatase [Pseudoclavibacter sp. RFBJ5]PPF92530.1 ADP-ribose pyrophosphatase [Pseudoclavibacter sp. RFBJ3]